MCKFNAFIALCVSDFYLARLLFSMNCQNRGLIYFSTWLILNNAVYLSWSTVGYQSHHVNMHFFEKTRGMIFMFVGNMLHKRFPFGCDHLLKSLLGGCSTASSPVAPLVRRGAGNRSPRSDSSLATSSRSRLFVLSQSPNLPPGKILEKPVEDAGCSWPVEMVTDYFYQVSYFLTALLFAQLQHLLSNGSSIVPDVKVVDNMTQSSFHMTSNGDVSVRYKCGNSEAISD